MLAAGEIDGFIAPRLVAVEELFHPATLESFKI